MTNNTKLKVHITGVYGLIGNLMYRHLSSQPELYDVYGSARRTVSSRRAGHNATLPLPEDHFTLADLSDARAVERAIHGMDAVLHIGAAPGPEASFEDVLHSNIIGTHNVLEACRKAGVKRLVYASSIMISFGYFQYAEPYIAIREGRLGDIPDPIPVITHRDAPRPTEAYSASKVYCEGLSRTYSDAHGISTVCLRIGYVNKEDSYEIHPYTQSFWFSQQECVRLFDLALAATQKPVFEICYGVTENPYRWVDLEHTREVLGFVSQGIPG